MAPCLASNDVRNYTTGQSVFPRKLYLLDGSFSESLAYRAHCLLSKLGTWMRFASGLAALLDLIAVIACGRVQKEVINTTARWVIASMTDMFPCRDWSVLDFPCESMCVNLPVVDAHDAVIAVRTDHQLPCPDPAFITIRSTDSIPEISSNLVAVSYSRSMAAFDRAKVPSDTRRCPIDITAMIADVRLRQMDDRMAKHREPPTRGVTPSAVSAARGHFYASIIPQWAV